MSASDLVKAINEKNLINVQSLVEKEDINYNEKDFVLLACQTKNIEIVRVLLASKNITIQNSNALFYAQRHRLTDIVEAIKEATLMHAIDDQDIQLLNMLLISNSNFKKLDPLLLACQTENLEIVELFLKFSKIDINSSRALSYAQEKKLTNIVDAIMVAAQAREKQTVSAAPHSVLFPSSSSSAIPFGTAITTDPNSKSSSV